MYRNPLLGPGSERSGFHCGVEALDRDFRERVQDVRRRITNYFVALDKQNRIAGFYTLAATSVLLTDLPEVIAKKLPRYPTVPAIRIGAVSGRSGGTRARTWCRPVGRRLSRSIDFEVAGFALAVDAKDDSATAFYMHHGFIPFSDQPRTMFLQLATVRSMRR